MTRLKVNCHTRRQNIFSGKGVTSIKKTVVRGEIEKSGMADHIWKEKGNHLLLWNEVEMIDRAEHWRIRRLKESAQMLGYNNLLSKASIKLNIIWQPIIKKLDKK